MSLHAQDVKYAILQYVYDYWKEKKVLAAHGASKISAYANDSTPSAVDFSTNCQNELRLRRLVWGFETLMEWFL
ncbi:hypothetical protein P8452_51972 [Trifolium repens]|nr:hypothetical protein P8452_51972 [Trifolium repens]